MKKLMFAMVVALSFAAVAQDGGHKQDCPKCPQQGQCASKPCQKPDGKPDRQPNEKPAEKTEGKPEGNPPSGKIGHF